MANITGTIEADNLFGTNRADVIRGFGGNNFMQGNGGADRISGVGQTDAGGGRDLWSSIDVLRRYPANIFTEADMGGGNDTAVMIEHDAFGGTINFGFFNGVDMGPGADKVFYGANAFAAKAILGLGADTAYIASEQSVAVSLGEFLTQSEDGARDTVHLDYDSGGVLIYGFEQNDKIVLHGTDISMAELKLRTTFLFDDQTYLTITLPNDSKIQIRKEWAGHLTADQIEIVSDPFLVQTRGMIGDDARLSKVAIASGGDDTVRALGRDVFLNKGDDTGIGSKGADGLYGQHGNDVLRGKGGGDTLSGGFGDDRLIGGRGGDVIFTGGGSDVVLAGGGADRVHVQRGDAIVKGGAGRDKIIVEDTISGDDLTLSGGRGNDIFVFNTRFSRTEAVLTDFRSGRDKVDLRGVVPDSYTQADIDRIYGDFEQGQEVTVAGGYRAGGLYISSFELLFEGLSSGDLTANDFIMI